METPITISERNKPPRQTNHLTLGCLVFPRMDQIDFAGPFEVLSRIPNSTIHVIAKTKSPVRDIAGTEVMGFLHKFADARMPIWGVSALLSNFLLVVLSRSGQRWFYLASLLMLILFVIIYNWLSKPINRLQTEAAKTGVPGRTASGVVNRTGSGV